MVAINKRPVRLLCSPNPSRGYPPPSLSLFFRFFSFFFASSSSSFRVPPSSTSYFFPVALSSLSLRLSFAAEFSTVVISEPCEASQSSKEVFHRRSAKEGKITRGPPPPPAPPPSPPSDFFFFFFFLLRVIVRVNGIAERRRERGVGVEGEQKDGESRLDGLCTFCEINSYVRHISGWLIVTAVATEINSRD